jgi:hypothetical protein
MSEETGKPLSWRRIWEVLRCLGLPRAVPGWVISLASTLWELTDRVHRVAFLADLFGGSLLKPVEFLQHWGWLVGAAWLAGVIFWAAAQPDKAAQAAGQAKALERLAVKISHAIERFEALSKIYEYTLTPAGAAPAVQARRQFLQSVGSALEAWLATVPADRQHEYKDVLRTVLSDYEEHGDPHSSIYARQESPMTPIRLALGIRPAVQEEQSPTAPADPPPS